MCIQSRCIQSSAYNVHTMCIQSSPYNVHAKQLHTKQCIESSVWCVQVAGQLFGVTVEAADGKAPVWNADVRFFCIKQDGKPKAYFFFVSVDTCTLLLCVGVGSGVV